MLEEAERGHPEAASQRLDVIKQLDVLSITEEVGKFTQILLEKGLGLVPIKAAQDALHAYSSTTEPSYPAANGRINLQDETAVTACRFGLCVHQTFERVGDEEITMGACQISLSLKL